MATLRYLAHYKSDQNVDWKYYIDDTLYNGAVTEFTSGDGVAFNYTTQTRKSPIESNFLPSTATIDFKNEDSGADTLQANILGAAEERFKVKVLKDNALYWTGFLLSDQIIVKDEPKPWSFILQASDGLGRLKDIDYNNSGTAYTGRETLLEHIFNCLEKIPLNYFYASTENFLKVVVNWYEDQHTVVSTLDPLAVTDVDHNVFYSTNGQGKKTYWSCYDVLKECLQIFGGRIYQSGGVWRIEQINERENATFTEFIYDIDRTHLSTDTSATYETTVNTTSNSARPRRAAGGNWGYYPALDKVCINYKHDSAANLLTGLTYNTTNSTETTLGNVTINANDETLLLTGMINFSSTWINVANLQNYRHVFKFKIKVGDFYLKRTINSLAWTFTYNPVEWTQDENWYYVSTPFLYQAGTSPSETIIDSHIDIAVNTPALQSGGDIDFDLDYVETTGYNFQLFGTSVQNTTYALSYDLINGNLAILEGGDPADMETSREYCATNAASDKNTTIVNLTTHIGDGPFHTTFNKLKVYDGSAWQVSDDWRVDDTGTAYKIQDLVIRQILALQKTPLKRYEGTIEGDIMPHSRLTWDSEYYLFNGGTHNTNKDRFRGRWFKIAVDDTDVDTEAPVPDEEVEVGGLGPEVSPGSVSNPVATGGVVVQGGGQTAGPLSGGFIESIEVDIPLDIQYQVGDIIELLDQSTGFTDSVTVTAATAIGDTEIVVEGYLTHSYPGGVSLIPSAPQNIPLSQLAGEIVNEFFESATIEKEGYLLKTKITPESYQFHLVNRTGALSTGVLEFFYVVPPALNGTTITRLYTAISTAAVLGNTTIDYKNGGSTFHTATIAPSTKTADDELTTPESLSTDDEITIEITAVGNSPTPLGLVVSPEITGKEIYLDKIKYQLNRVLTNNLVLWHKLNYVPQVPISNGAAIFSSNNYLDCGSDDSLNMTSQLTLMTWVKFSDFVSTDFIAGKYSVSTGYGLYTQGTNIIFAVAGQFSCAFATTGMEANKWYHLAATYDGTGAKLYLDGEEKDTATYTVPTTNAFKFMIGASDNGSGTGVNFFTGSLACLRLYDIGLTATEVQNHMIKKYSKLEPVDKVNLISSWELSDISSTTAPDTFGDNDGTIT